MPLLLFSSFITNLSGIMSEINVFTGIHTPECHNVSRNKKNEWIKTRYDSAYVPKSLLSLVSFRGQN
jgi:hypothetical protein